MPQLLFQVPDITSPRTLQGDLSVIYKEPQALNPGPGSHSQQVLQGDLLVGVLRTASVVRFLKKKTKRQKIGHNTASGLPGSKNSHQTLALKHPAFSWPLFCSPQWGEAFFPAGGILCRGHYHVRAGHGTGLRVGRLPRATGVLTSAEHIGNAFSTPVPNANFCFSFTP